MSLTTRTIVGEIVYGDGTGGSGTLRFTPEALIAVEGKVVLPGPVVVVAGNGGTFEVDLVVTDAEGYNPENWVWKVEESFPGGRTFFFELPSGEGPVSYTELIPATSIADPFAAHEHTQYLTFDDIGQLVAGVNTVNGLDGDVTLGAADVGAYPDDNPAGFVDASGASQAAPVQSVNSQIGDVTLDASDVGAYPDNNPSGFIDAAGAPVQSVNGETGAVSLSAADVGAYPDDNPDGFVDSSGAAAASPVQSVNTQTGDVNLTASDVGAYPDDNPSGFVDSGGAASAAPVQSVNSQTGDVSLSASDVGAYPDDNPDAYVDAQGAAAAAPVQSVNGETGTVNLSAQDVGAYPDNNPDGFVDASGAAAAAPVQSVNGETGTVDLTAADVGAYPDDNPSSFVDAAGAAAAAPVQSVNGETGEVDLDASDVGALPDDAALDDLSDVDVTGAVEDDLLAYDGSDWVATSEPKVQRVSFDTATPGQLDAAGDVAWDDLDQALSYRTNGITVDIAQENLIYVRNPQGADTISAGQAVSFAGASANRVQVQPCKADEPGVGCATAGIALETIGPNSFGFVSTFGLVRGFNTNNILTDGGPPVTQGQELFISTTPGVLATFPAESPARRVTVGYVVTTGNNGSIFVTVRRGLTVNELDNVLAASPTDGQTLTWDNAQGVWKPVTPTPAPVTSVNTQTGAVVLGAADVGAYPDTNPSNFIDAAGAPVQSVNGETGTVSLSAADVGALADNATLDDLTGVSVPSPSDGDALLYDENTSTWVAGAVQANGDGFAFQGVWQPGTGYDEGDLVLVSDERTGQSPIVNAHRSMYRALVTSSAPQGTLNPRVSPGEWELVSGFERQFFNLTYVGQQDPNTYQFDFFDIFHEGPGSTLFIFLGQPVPLSQAAFDLLPFPNALFADPVEWEPGEYQEGDLVEQTFIEFTVVWCANTTTSEEPGTGSDWFFVAVNEPRVAGLPLGSINDLSDVFFNADFTNDGDVLTWNAGFQTWLPAAPGGGGGPASQSPVFMYGNQFDIQLDGGGETMLSHRSKFFEDINPVHLTEPGVADVTMTVFDPQNPADPRIVEYVFYVNGSFATTELSSNVLAASDNLTDFGVDLVVFDDFDTFTFNIIQVKLTHNTNREFEEFAVFVSVQPRGFAEISPVSEPSDNNEE